MSAKPSTKPAVGPLAASGTKPSSPPVEPNASNLACNKTDAGLSQPAPEARGRSLNLEPRAPGSRSGSRTGSPKELLARYQAENPEKSIFDVDFDLLPPGGTTWEQARQELNLFGDSPALPKAPTAPASDDLPPTMRREASPDGRTTGGRTLQDSSSAETNTQAPSGTGATFGDINFDLDDDPELKKQLLALNDKYATPEAKASSVLPAPQGGRAAWKAGAFARTRSASLGDVPRPTPAAASKEAPPQKEPEPGLREKLKRWWSDPRVRNREPKK